MKFIENNTYTLQTDKGLAPYNSVKVVCTYVEDNTVWFVEYLNPTAAVIDSQHYKLNRKTNKLYKLNNVFSSWDSIENTLSEDPLGSTTDDVWSKRMGYQSYSYDGMSQGD